MSHLIMGLIALVLGVWGIIEWWVEFGAFFRGLIPMLLVLGGLAAVGSGLKKQSKEMEAEEQEV